MEEEPRTAVQVRIPSHKLERFKDIFSWRGAFQQFTEECLDEFLKVWGNKPTPKEMVHDAVQRVVKPRV